MTARPDKRALAAKLLAETKLSFPEIAAKVGCSTRTLGYWRDDPAFGRLLDEARNAWRARANAGGLADLDFTLRNLQDRHKRCRAVIEARAADPTYKNQPGWRTGLLTVTQKMKSLGDKQGQVEVPEFAVDTGLLEEMRAIEVQIATHLGTWKRRIEYSDDSKPKIDSTQIAIAVTFVRPTNPEPGPVSGEA